MLRELETMAQIRQEKEDAEDQARSLLADNWKMKKQLEPLFQLYKKRFAPSNGNQGNMDSVDLGVLVKVIINHIQKQDKVCGMAESYLTDEQLIKLGL